MNDKCDNCGADLSSEPVPSVLGGFDVVCGFCGHRHHIPAEPVRVVAAPPPPAAKPTTPAPAERTVSVRLFLGVSAAVIAVTALLVYFVAVRKGIAGAHWDDVGGWPAIATIGGHEVAIGRMRGNVDNKLSIAAFDSTTLKQLWTAGPYGTYTEGYRYTDWAVSGSWVAVTDFHAQVHTLDLSTGKEQHVLSLTDKVDRICPAGAGQVAIQQIDKRTVIIDLASQRVREAPLPASCGGTPDMDAMMALSIAVRAIPHFEPSGDFNLATFRARDMDVLIGTKTPGTPTPMVVGLDKTNLSVRWQVPLPATDLATVRDGSSGHKNAAVCGDRFIGTYGAGQKSWHVTALDATSGVRQWDVVLKPARGIDTLRGVKCSATRVYVVRNDSLDVLDATSGRVLGTI